MSTNVESNVRQETDQVLVDIAEYVADYVVSSDEAMELRVTV